MSGQLMWEEQRRPIPPSMTTFFGRFTNHQAEVFACGTMGSILLQIIIAAQYPSSMNATEARLNFGYLAPQTPIEFASRQMAVISWLRTMATLSHILHPMDVSHR
ncbi:hypothetical protein FGO68_gene5761 [Halteria grandinella]|uniref:Uncharacterized protein n=1 Tax=Halteria grandinella TaxID=5974 RepID=A0A8J8NRK5_HALGN|nr:hypothetical protein FGO68_gene5761 [Halteria grandinella]